METTVSLKYFVNDCSNWDLFKDYFIEKLSFTKVLSTLKTFVSFQENRLI